MIPFLECGPFYLSWSTQEAGTLKMSHFHVPPQSVHTCQCTHVSSHVALTAQTDKGSQAGACAKQGPGGVHRSELLGQEEGSAGARSPKLLLLGV